MEGLCWQTGFAAGSAHAEAASALFAAGSALSLSKTGMLSGRSMASSIRPATAPLSSNGGLYNQSISIEAQVSRPSHFVGPSRSLRGRKGRLDASMLMLFTATKLSESRATFSQVLGSPCSDSFVECRMPRNRYSMLAIILSRSELRIMPSRQMKVVSSGSDATITRLVM